MPEEKPLDKCTVKELREVAQGIEELHGISAMKKDELLHAIKDARGIPSAKPRSRASETIVDVKQNIRALKEEREELRERQDRAAVKRLRRKISRLKKKSRNIARARS